MTEILCFRRVLLVVVDDWSLAAMPKEFKFFTGVPPRPTHGGFICGGGRLGLRLASPSCGPFVHFSLAIGYGEHLR